MDSIDLFDDFNEENDQAMGDFDDGDGDNQDENQATNTTKQEVDPGIKVVKVKRKLVTLNPERLKGPRGIIAIDDFFQNIKFKGRGYEKDDLKEVMKRLEHWSHRMFPKYNFDDALSKIERLGRKKEISNHMTRYRLGQLVKDDEQNPNVLSDEDQDKEDTLANELPIDEFENLINQQIALSTTSLPSTSFVGNISGISGITHVPQSSQIMPSSQVDNEPSQQQQQQTPSQPPKVQLTDEQRAKIEENKKRAMALREARMKQQEEEKRKKEEEELKKKKAEGTSQIFSDLLFDDDFV